MTSEDTMRRALQQLVDAIASHDAIANDPSMDKLEKALRRHDVFVAWQSAREALGYETTCADEMVGHWHKVAAALTAKLGGSDVRLELADFKGIEGKAVVVSHENGGHTMRVRVLSEAEAYRIGADYQRAARRKQ